MKHDYNRNYPDGLDQKNAPWNAPDYFGICQRCDRPLTEDEHINGDYCAECIEAIEANDE